MINGKLDGLNDAGVDTNLLDRTLEFGEALGELQTHPGIITSSYTQDDYMMQGFREYLEENEPGMDISML
jgi:hypothetical protein